MTKKFQEEPSADQKKSAVMNAFGLPAEFMDSLSDEQLEMLATAALMQMAGGTEEPAEGMQEGTAMSREELIAWLTEQGQDPAELEAMTDEQLQALYQQLSGEGTVAMSETRSQESGVRNQQKPTAPAPTATPAAPALAFYKDTLKALRAERKALAAELAASAKLRQQSMGEAKRQRIDAFCESMKGQKKVSPAEVDDGPDGQPGPVKARLLRADAVSVVRRFSEGGKAVALTELDLQMREIEQRPAGYARLFAEQIAQEAGGGPQVSDTRRRQLLGHTNLGRSILRQQDKRN